MVDMLFAPFAKEIFIKPPARSNQCELNLF